MELDVRLAALSKLVDVNSPAVDARLRDELRSIETTLANSTDYDELSAALKTLAVIASKFHAAVVPLLASFTQSIITRTLMHDGEPLSEARLRYRSANHLIKEAIGAAYRVAYVHTSEFIDFLLELRRSPTDEIRDSSTKAIEEFATFDLNLFYGERGVGAQPQATLVAHLAALEDGQLFECVDLVLRVLSRVLSPSLEGRGWTYNSVTLTRGSIVSDGGVADMRASAINLLKRMFALSPSVSYRRKVLGTLDTATRQERPAENVATAEMFERDAVEVLHFLRDHVHTEALPLVQNIEHQAYWDYFHGATDAVKAAALEVRDTLVSHDEYQVYKQLIGFEGIFGDWEDLTRSERAWDYSNTKRLEAMRRYLDEISDETYDKWRDRILEFAKTESDDLAMFPVFYEFLEGVAREQPRLALELVIFHEVHMSRFLIPLIGGLWLSDRPVDINAFPEMPLVGGRSFGSRQEYVEAIVKCWIEAGRHLTVIAKSLFKGGIARLDTLAAVVSRAAEINDRWAIVIAMGVAATLYSEGGVQAKEVFMSALRTLAKLGDASWASTAWYSRPVVTLVGAMDADEQAEILRSMELLPKLGFESEEVLNAIGKHDPSLVLDFVLRRLDIEKALNEAKHSSANSGIAASDYEPIPYHMHRLNELLAPISDAVVSALRGRFDPEQSAFFQYEGGAQLLKGLFPKFDAPLQSRLIKLVESGDATDVEFVLAVVRAYGGSAPILDLCKAIAKVVPKNSVDWDELRAALTSTGVVMGEFGFAEALELKRDQIASWKRDENEHVRAFADWLIENLEPAIDAERQRAIERIELRKYRYGAGSDE